MFILLNAAEDLFTLIVLLDLKRKSYLSEEN